MDGERWCRVYRGTSWVMGVAVLASGDTEASMTPAWCKVIPEASMTPLMNIWVAPSVHIAFSFLAA